MADPWQPQVEAFGEFIRMQRKLAKLSLRQLGAATDLSDAYLSQLERGLHAPSLRVLRSLAGAFSLSTESLLAEAGLVDRPEQQEGRTEAAILADPRLTDAQKEALLAVYRGFVTPAG